MKKLLLIGVLVSGAAYGMDEKRMLTELLALQRIQTGKDLVKISQKSESLCPNCGSDNLERTAASSSHTQRSCRWCGKTIDIQELRDLTPHGVDLIRKGLELLKSITSQDRVEQQSREDISADQQSLEDN